MESKGYSAKIEDEGQTFSESCNAARSLMIAQSQHNMAGDREQQQQNIDYENNFL